MVGCKTSHLKKDDETDREHQRRIRMNANQKRYYEKRRQNLIDAGQYVPQYQSKYVKS